MVEAENRPPSTKTRLDDRGGPGDDVTAGVDAGDRRSKAGVGRDIAALVQREARGLAVFTFGAVIVYSLLFVFSSWNPFEIHMESALARLASHLVPAGALLMALLIRPEPVGAN